MTVTAVRTTSAICPLAEMDHSLCPDCNSTAATIDLQPGLLIDRQSDWIPANNERRRPWQAFGLSSLP